MLSYGIILIVILMAVLGVMVILYYRSVVEEPFYDTSQTLVPKSDPAGLSWEFQSPKSNIKNFNEDTQFYQDLNKLQPNTSNLIGLNQGLPLWIYPYHYLNHSFGQIILTLANQIEKDHNDNHLLEETPNEEWQAKYPYQETQWDLLGRLEQSLITDVITELNRRFNTDPPIVGVRHERIRYYWRNRQEVLIIIWVYKRYTASDIIYEEDLLNPGLNDDLKDNFERELLIYADQVDDQSRYHLRFLRFPKIDYSKDNPIEDMRSIASFDDKFYLAKSKDPLYRMLTNTEVRSFYLEYLNKKPLPYKCFNKHAKGTKDLSRTTDQTSCELANGIWEKRCQKDTDCPYFQANKNYPNKFGGCNVKTGYCQWPEGVKARTYRVPENPTEATCYNCEDGSLGKSTAGICCPAQNNRRVYLNLESPDYKFEQDMDLRFYYRKLFDKYKVNWSPYN